ncbi:13146_t:CDS:2 [Dentiscutata erythropus]|uniref:13146_t:CDS:1 n=1 Tax=Dentiscutata erythropus TaxID=1348616 RepID=A0A9N9GPU6_9GLOM|nr:13146_t:CDS:2 [Dentiscutata erythropus]
MVIRKLKSVKKEVDDSDNPTVINKTVISSVVRRVVWYPVVPLVAQFFSSILQIYGYVNHASSSLPLLVLCFIGISLQGLMNALVFSQDVAVTRAFQAVKLHWWISYVNCYEFHYPYRSYNKAITDESSMQEKNNEWLRYMLLIKIFSAPKTSSQLVSSNFLPPINSFVRNKSNTYSALFGNDNSKQDIAHDNQNNQDIHLVLPESVHVKNSSQDSPLDLLSHYLNLDSYNQTNQTKISNISNICASPNSTTNISNYTVGADEGRIDVMLVNDEPTDVDLSKEIEMSKLMLKRL